MQSHAELKPGYRKLWVIPFILVLGWYFIGAELKHAKNKNNKMQPTVGQLTDAVKRVAFERDDEDDIYRLWTDTAVTGRRFLICTALMVPAIVFGLVMGRVRVVQAIFYSFITTLSHLQTIALIPLMIIFVGTGEMSKILLVMVSLAPKLILEVYEMVHTVPEELIIKGHTMAASTSEIIFCIILPSILPRIVDTMRLTMAGIIQFLLIGETIAADAGWGYRMQVGLRNMSIDILLVYATWICLVAYTVHYLMGRMNHYLFPWARK